MDHSKERVLYINGQPMPPETTVIEHTDERQIYVLRHPLPAGTTIQYEGGPIWTQSADHAQPQKELPRVDFTA